MSDYSTDAFVKELDEAIVRTRKVVEQSWGLGLQPKLLPGVSMPEAIVTVCVALLLRNLARTQLQQVLDLIDEVLGQTRAMLIAKNAAYGNSALDPVRVFSKASLKEQLLVRLDDKVSRLARGSAAGEDVTQDMLGYLLLIDIAENREHK